VTPDIEAAAVRDDIPISERPVTGSSWWRRAWTLPEVRWATAATVLFLAGLIVDLAGGAGWIYWSLFLACYVAGGWEPGWAGVQELRNKRLDVDLLMVVAAIGAASIGQVLDGGLLIVIFATSGALEAVATKRTEDSVRGLLELAPDTATRVGSAPGTEETVRVDDLAVGEVILVRPGERIGADGTVLHGSSEVDQATITGEPLHVDKTAGAEVFAGTLNGTGALRVRVDRPAAESVVARIAGLVEEAARTKAKTQLFIEKIEQRYSVGMVAATVALFVIPLLLGEPVTPTLLRAMTFMIVASPCAVVLATMPPLLAAIANAGRHSVLVKSAVVMEQLGATTQVVIDKTGTLTRGTPHLAEIRLVDDAPFTRDQILTIVASAEHPSEHPLAAAVVSAARAAGLTLTPVDAFTATAGVGVTATVDGRRVQIGGPTALLAGSDLHDQAARTAIAELQTVGATAVVVLIDGEPVAVLGIVDQLRPEAPATVQRLTQLTGKPPVLLTGAMPRPPPRSPQQSASPPSAPSYCPTARSPRSASSKPPETTSRQSATVSTTLRRWPQPRSASPWAVPDPISPCRPRTRSSYGTTCPPSPTSSRCRGAPAEL
jgi:heavy metal translocating P-type ATPase